MNTKYVSEALIGFLAIGFLAASFVFKFSPEVTFLAEFQILALGIVSWRLRASDRETKDEVVSTLSNEHGKLKSYISSNETSKGAIQSMYDVLGGQSGELHQAAWHRVNACVADLEKINSGIVPLDEASYYQEIISRMQSTQDGEEVLAVNTIDERRWTEEPRQRNYGTANRKALSRGAKVSRVFVFDKGDPDQSKARAYAAIAKLDEINDSSDTSIVWRQDLSANSYLLEDWVLFKSSPPALYIAQADPVDRTRVRRADKVTNPDQIHEYQNRFAKLLSFRSSLGLPSGGGAKTGASNRDNEVTEINPAGSAFPAPGEVMSALYLEHNVVTCEEASRAKGLPLSSELKSLIVTTSLGNVIVHVPGDREVSLRSIKDGLKVEEAHLASEDTLSEVGVRPGTVCPILEPCWSLPHLVDERVLSSDIVTTNNGSLNGYFVFDPTVLLESYSVTRGMFCDDSK